MRRATTACAWRSSGDAARSWRGAAHAIAWRSSGDTARSWRGAGYAHPKSGWRFRGGRRRCGWWWLCKFVDRQNNEVLPNLGRGRGEREEKKRGGAKRGGAKREEEKRRGEEKR